MSRRIVFIHGAWVTPSCWDQFVEFFTSRGYDCHAPAWPGKQRPIEDIRADPSPLKGLGIEEIVNHYDRIIRDHPEPPILVGHSFGGLVVQILLDRGLGAAGVAIDSAPPSGIPAFELTAIRSLASVLLTPFVWRRVVRWPFQQFRYAFVHTLQPESQRAAYERHVTPESGRIFVQGALAGLRPGGPCRVNFGNPSRAPLLLVAGSEDHIVPASVNRRNHRRYAMPGIVTDFKEFPGRTHWIIAQDGWEEVASHIESWLSSRSTSAPLPGTG